MKTVYCIPGIHCSGCAALIKDVSGDYPAITSTDVDLTTKLVTLEHEPNFDTQKWKKEIESLNEAYVIHDV